LAGIENRLQYSVKLFDEDGELTQTTITKAEADAIEKLNKKKEFVNAIIAQ